MATLTRRRWWVLGVMAALGATTCRHGASTDSVARAGVVGTANAARGRAATVRAVPRIDAAMRDRLARIAAVGAQRGMRREVFAKIGDSITESGSFLQDVGHGWFDLGSFTALEPTIAFYRRAHVDHDGNDSFAHSSEASVSGWTVQDALAAPRPDALERELTALRPAVAFVMFGTNDLDRSTPDAFRAGITEVVNRCLERGTIPVLSTIPDRLDRDEAARRVAMMNVIVRDIAQANGLPVIDLFGALRELPRHGLGDDGIHPSAYARDGDVRAATFTDEGLRHGYNVRNLVTLQTLDAIRRIVFEREPPEA